MTRITSLRRVRRAHLARVFGVVLILLALFPFTAPFSICDAAELVGGMATGDERPGARLVDDDVHAALAPLAFLPPLIPARLVLASIAVTCTPRPILLIALRV